MIQTIKNYLWHYPKALFAAARYGFPSSHLTLIGITGTDGKTTTCNLIYETLQKAGYKAGLLSTIGAKIDQNLLPIPPHMTSQDPLLIQKIFRQMVDKKVTHVVVEVTAHALDQFRFGLCRFEIAAITNTAHEHLDYFKNMTQYIDTKSKIFSNSKVSILNKDDPSFPIITSKYTQNFITYSQKTSATYQAQNIKISEKEMTFVVNQKKFITDSPYTYQVNNILASYSVCHELGIKNEIFFDTIKKFPFMKGRREEVENTFGFRTLIDFAHTPQALDQTLTSLKKTTTGRLIVIFGATGGRDQTKRPIMGQIVSKLADIAIVTADDTRHEHVAKINQQIISGFHQSNEFSFYDIPNRQDAFNLAIKIAKENDTIIACGKGHETTILHGTTEYPWSERSAFETAFKLRESHATI